MGANFCKSQTFNRLAEFYYKDVNSNELDNNAKEKVKLTISIIKPVPFAQYQVTFQLYESKTSITGTSVGNTESTSSSDGNSVIHFTKFFSMEYYFEKEQPIGFTVHINNKPVLIKTSLGEIMGSRGQKYQARFESSTLEINGKSLELEGNFKGIFEIAFNGLTPNSNCGYIIKNFGTQNNPSNSPIYKSEVISASHGTFKRIELPLIYISAAGKNYSESMINIEILDFKKGKRLGEITATLASLLGNTKNVNLAPQGSVSIKCEIKQTYTFLDYLRGGMQIALMIGIDFTASNKSPSDPDSLHNITSQKMNAYELAIKSCGNIVGYYDYDQLFPVYGYGAIIPGENKVNHCFHVNGLSDPNIHTIDGVLQAYRNILPYVKLYGPTYFAPIINKLNEQVHEDLKSGNTMQYNILMILTDGQINDMDATIDALVEASYLPISVIIIGIGYADFNNMDILDADDNPLYDSNKRKAARDLVQFVPFYKFQNNGDILAQQVLEEVPRQVCEYYEQHNMIPNDPIINV